MRPRNRIHFLAFLCALVLALSAGAADPTGEEGGIGGTGIIRHNDPGDEGGIGGTGIVGVITGFGSILVNGVHVDYDPRMPLQDLASEAPLTASDLQIGQVVEVVASRHGERYRALRLGRRHLLAGPVTAIEPLDNTMSVMGQRVLLSDDTTLGALDSIRVGDRIAVSGLWHGGQVEATRIDSHAGSRDLVAGPVRASLDGTLLVGDMSLQSASQALPTDLRVGDEITALGSAHNGWFLASETRRRGAAPFGERVREMIVEGYPGQDDRGLRLGGLRLDGSGITPGLRSVVRGSLAADGRLQVQSTQRPAGQAANGVRRWPQLRNRVAPVGGGAGAGRGPRNGESSGGYGQGRSRPQEGAGYEGRAMGGQRRGR
jgi:hypothetical protein